MATATPKMATSLCSSTPKLSPSPELHARRCCFASDLHSLRRRRHFSSIAAAPRRPLLPRIEAKKQSDLWFEELLVTSDKPLLVDFYATWCGPCQFMVPILAEVSEKFKDKIEVVKIDTEKNVSLADRYEIEALPTFIMFKDGEPCDRFEGAMPADKFINHIQTVLADMQ